MGGIITAASEGLSRDELELEDPEVHAAELAGHDHEVVGAARIDAVEREQ